MIRPHSRAEVAFDEIREIGQDGRNSRTYVVRDHQLDAEIVMKRLEKAKFASPATFFAEAQALYASTHPNVVQIHYACQDEDYVYIAMPFYRDGSVKGLITGKHMSVRRIVTISCQVLTGLHNIHAKRLIHFDVKPDNILLSPRGEALLSDFGLAKQMNFTGRAEQDRAYNPMLPPEFFDTDQFDRTFDIYQFGLTLYRMCVGNDAFYAQLAEFGPRMEKRNEFRFAVRNGRFPDLKAYQPHIPARLRNIVARCLMKYPADRYQSAIDVANAFAGIDDKAFDWNFAESAGTRSWVKNENGTEYRFVVNPDTSCVLTKSKDGGQPRRVGDGCKAAISEREAQKLLGSY